MSLILPELPYAYDAFEPRLDARTMEIHYTKHHQAYIDKALEALARFPLFHYDSVVDILSRLDTVPEEIRTLVRNNVGGHYNHTLFWESITPQATTPSTELRLQIEQAFGTFDNCLEQLVLAGTNRFGSGFVWLVAYPDKSIGIMTTPNQDTPLMEDASLTPLLAIDVWEHAYYLLYQNKRADYLRNLVAVLDWHKASKRYAGVVY